MTSSTGDNSTVNVLVQVRRKHLSETLRAATTTTQTSRWDAGLFSQTKPMLFGLTQETRHTNSPSVVLFELYM